MDAHRDSLRRNRPHGPTAYHPPRGVDLDRWRPRRRAPRRRRAPDRLPALGARAGRHPRAARTLRPGRWTPVPARARRRPRAIDAADPGLVGGRRPAAAVQRHAGTRPGPAAARSLDADARAGTTVAVRGAPIRLADPSVVDPVRDAGSFTVADGASWSVFRFVPRVDPVAALAGASWSRCSRPRDGPRCGHARERCAGTSSSGSATPAHPGSDASSASPASSSGGTVAGSCSRPTRARSSPAT